MGVEQGVEQGMEQGSMMAQVEAFPQQRATAAKPKLTLIEVIRSARTPEEMLPLAAAAFPNATMGELAAPAPSTSTTAPEASASISLMRARGGVRFVRFGELEGHRKLRPARPGRCPQGVGCRRGVPAFFMVSGVSRLDGADGGRGAPSNGRWCGIAWVCGVSH